jgi:hypothetical protein
MTDDHGDQFPGALPPVAEYRAASSERVARMQADYVHKANSLVEAGRDDLAHELAVSFAEETGSPRHPAGRHTPPRGQGGRRPGKGSRLGRLTRRSLRRFDQYTLDVFNPGTPYRRSDR